MLARKLNFFEVPPMHGSRAKKRKRKITNPICTAVFSEALCGAFEC